MAGNEATLTAILQLKDNMSAELAKTRTALTKLQSGFADIQQKANKAFTATQSQIENVGGSLKKAAASVDEFSAAQSRSVTSTARAISRLIGLHTVMSSLTDVFGENTKLGNGIRITHDSLAAFVGISVAMPGPIGLAVGALAGLGTAFAGVQKANRAVDEEMAKFRKHLDDTTRKLDETRGAWKAAIETANNPALASNESGQKSAQEAIGRQIAARDRARATMAGNGNPLSIEFLKAKESADDAQGEIDKLTESLKNLKNESASIQLDEKLKGIGAEADGIHELVMAGLVSPLEGAERRLQGIESVINDLVRMKDKLAPDEFAAKFDDLLQKAAREKSIINADKLQNELNKVKANIETWSQDTGIALGDGAMAQLELLGRESNKKLHDALDGIRQQVESDPFKGMELALLDLTKASYSFRDAWRGIFGDIEEGISNAFADAATHAKKLTDSFKDLGKSLLRDIIKMFTGAATQGALSSLGGGLLGLLGLGGSSSNAVATVGAGAGTVQAGGSGGVNLSSIASGVGGALGLSGGSLAAIGGLGAAGAALTAAGVSGGNVTQGTTGGILAGASAGALLGSVVPGVGTLIGAAAGAIIGGVAGFLGSSKKKRKKAREAQRQAAAALAAYNDAIAKARVVVKSDIRGKLGQGLSTEEQAADVGHLFSGDLSADELQQFGDPATIAAQAGAVNKQTNVNVGGITVQATIAGTYDVQRLAEDLSYHLMNQAGGAGGP